MKKTLSKLNPKIIFLNLVVFVGMVILLSSLSFLVGLTINYLTVPMSAFLSYILTSKIFKGNDNVGYNIIASFVIVALAIMISLLFYDLTWDGNVYHKELIGLLKNGLNPMYNRVTGDIWTRHYANGTEIFAGSLYAFTNNIEAGKCINIILAISVFYYSFRLISDLKINKIFKYLFSFTLAFNPIVLNQFCSYYIDGVVSLSIFLTIISLLLFIKNNNKFNGEIATLFFFSSIIAVNAKFTSLLIWALYFGVLGAYVLINNLITKEYENFRKFILLGFSAFIVSIFICGSSSYVRNMVEHNHPFYPLMGKNAVDIESDNEPELFRDFSHTKKWLYATYSRTYTWYNKNPKLKVPFSIHNDEMDSIYYPDIRIGGLGIWYSAVLSLSILFLFVSLSFLFKRNKKAFLLIIIMFAATFGPIPKLPIVWQARYYPQLYLVGFISVFSLLYSNIKIGKYLSYLVILTMLGNSILCFPSISKKYDMSRKVNETLSYLAATSQTKKVIIGNDNYTFYGAYYNYIDKNIKYEFSDERIEDGVPFYFGALYKIEE